MDTELSTLLNNILWGRRYISVKDGNGKPHTLVAKELELEDKIWIDFIYKQALTNGKEQKLMPSSELAGFLEDCGVWTKKDNKEIQNLKISLGKIKETLKEEISKREEKFSLKLQKRLTAELNKKQGIKSNHFINSLETYAGSQRVNASIFVCLYKDASNRYWPEWQDFLDETDSVFIRNATIEIFNKKPLTVKQVRAIARSSGWRFKWSAYKTSGDLFGKPLKELTGDQDSLIYWSQVYDAAYESMDRPSQSIIDDDEALDKWFEDQAKKRKTKEAESGKNDIGKKGTSKIWRHSEVGIITNPDAQADINRSAKLGIAKDTYIPSTEEVNAMNSPLARKLRQHEEKKIKRYGVIEETELRSDGNSRRAIGSKDVVFKKSRRPDGFTGKSVVNKMPGGTLQGRKE
jgi:hypothetical protein